MLAVCFAFKYYGFLSVKALAADRRLTNAADKGSGVGVMLDCHHMLRNFEESRAWLKLSEPARMLSGSDKLSPSAAVSLGHS